MQEGMLSPLGKPGPGALPGYLKDLSISKFTEHIRHKASLCP